MLLQPFPSVTERVNVYVPQADPAKTDTEEALVGLVKEPFPVIDHEYEVIKGGPL